MNKRPDRHLCSAAILLTFLLLVAIPAAADITVGPPADTDNGNCFPFGCAYNGEYQQVYSQTQFSRPITITNLEFYNTAFNNHATAMNSGNWAISLSTASADWNTLSATYATNIGTDNTLVFSGNLAQPWAFGDTLHINLSSPFTYDPSSGNLLMDVVVSGASAPGGNIYFDANGYNFGGFNGNTFLGRAYTDGVNHGYGLVTTFSTGAAPVPEPGLVGFVGLALTGMGMAIRRRKS